MQTQRGYDRLATVLGPATQPNSHQVKAGDATYTRNRRHLLQTPEVYASTRSARDPPAATAVDSPPSPQHTTVVTEVARDQQSVTVSRSGRVSKASSPYDNFVTDQI